jgi:hypothetical protein
MLHLATELEQFGPFVGRQRRLRWRPRRFHPGLQRGDRHTEIAASGLSTIQGHKDFTIRDSAIRGSGFSDSAQDSAIRTQDSGIQGFGDQGFRISDQGSGIECFLTDTVQTPILLGVQHFRIESAVAAEPPNTTNTPLRIGNSKVNLSYTTTSTRPTSPVVSCHRTNAAPGVSPS